MSHLERILDSGCDFGDAGVHQSPSPKLLAEMIDQLGLDVVVSSEHRRRALYILGRWGDPAAVGPIQRLVPHLDDQERVVAIDALGRIGSEEALATVMEHAADPSPDVRRFVVTALQRAGTQGAEERLLSLAEDDPVEFVRTRARQAASRVESSRTQEPSEEST